jgi:hypothetical protein
MKEQSCCANTDVAPQNVALLLDRDEHMQQRHSVVPTKSCNCHAHDEEYQPDCDPGGLVFANVMSTLLI